MWVYTVIWSLSYELELLRKKAAFLALISWNFQRLCNMPKNISFIWKKMLITLLQVYRAIWNFFSFGKCDFFQTFQIWLISIGGWNLSDYEFKGLSSLYNNVFFCEMLLLTSETSWSLVSKKISNFFRNS